MTGDDYRHEVLTENEPFDEVDTVRFEPDTQMTAPELFFLMNLYSNGLFAASESVPCHTGYDATRALQAPRAYLLDQDAVAWLDGAHP